LWDSHERPWEYTHAEAKSIFLDCLVQSQTIGSSEELEAHLPSKDNIQHKFPSNQFFYLNPVTKHCVMVPRIRLEYDFARHIPLVRVYLGLFLLHDGKLKSLGFRFETPEGEGLHNFYHAQMFIEKGPPLPYHAWLPTSQPSFPLDAEDPVQLLLCLLTSLYGLGYLGEVFRDSRIRHINGYIEGMSCRAIGNINHYRLVTFPNQKRPAAGFDIPNLLVGNFKTNMQKRHPGCRIERITKVQYDRIPGDKKKIFSG